MDPISPVASVLTLVATALAASKGAYTLISSVVNAPLEILMLSNEIEDLRVVLASIQLSLEASGYSERKIETADVLPTVLRRAEDKLKELELFLASFRPSAAEHVFRIKKLDWSLRGKEKAKSIREELQSLKWAISTSLGSLSASSSQRIGLAVESVSFEVRSLHNNLGRAAVAFQEQQKSASLAIEGVRQSQDQLMNLVEAKVNQLRIEAAENSSNMFIAGQLNSALPPSAVAVQLSMQQRSLCVPSCACSCHQWRELRSPKLLHGLIGSLFVGYTGAPLMTRKCTEMSCKVRATYALQVCYRFPLWMLARAVLLAAWSRQGQPMAGLSVAQIRPHSSLVFALAESGNVAGLKYAFDNRLASPFDCSADTGDYPLHITADHGFVEASRLLLSYGADPHAYDTDQKNTPHSFAWGIILAKNIPAKHRRQMASLFPDVYASNKFTRLHEIVLELQHGDLNAESEKEDFDIDAQDKEGNTALQWACARKDVVTAKWLLERGADPNIRNHNIGRTALMAACGSVSLPCIKLLVEHGVDVNTENDWGLDAMVYLSDEYRHPRLMPDILTAAKLLIAHGIQLEVRGTNEVCCLARAARTELVELMALLLDHGVDINRRNRFGATALTRSVAWSAARSARFLLARGASYTGAVEQDTDGRILLHHAALNPSTDMVKVLIDARLTGLNPDALDHAGFTADDYDKQAAELPEGFAPAFQHLLADVRASYYYLENELTRGKLPRVEANEVDEEDEFFDAHESQLAVGVA